MRSETAEARHRLYLLAHALVARHYREQLTLARLAGELASSPRQIQRAYAQFGPASFGEDLRDRRLRAAARLLAEQPSLRVAEVARLVGYRQAPHLSRAFSARFGHTPAAYRALARRAVQASREPPATAAPWPGASSPSDGGGAGSSASGSVPGSRSRISVPPPGAGSAVTAPPC